MKLLFNILILISLFLPSLAQQEELFVIKGDNVVLTKKGASYLAQLPLKCIQQEFPNKTSHISNEESDHVLLPSELHPTFYGCFDWHSSVHGHWMLVKLLKTFPNFPESEVIRVLLDQQFEKSKIEKEAAYFRMPHAKHWERTYGWAWLLKLDEELYTWNDEQAKRWHKNLQPLTDNIVQAWYEFLPKQTYPNRTGVHANTAFGLVFALDYARARKNKIFEKAITQSSLKLFQNDKNAPTIWEPNGADFLSPSLEEADLMMRILSKEDFIQWRDEFFTDDALQHLTNLPIVSDRADLQIVHLDGLCFSRSWCMRALAETYPKTHPNHELLKKAANNHLLAALKEILSRHYSGEHWLASFAIYALLFNR